MMIMHDVWMIDHIMIGLITIAMRLEFLFVVSACSGGLCIDVLLYTLVEDQRLKHLLFDCVIITGLWVVLSGIIILNSLPRVLSSNPSLRLYLGTIAWPLALSYRAARRQKQVAAQLVSAARLDQMLAVLAIP